MTEQGNPQENATEADQTPETESAPRLLSPTLTVVAIVIPLVLLVAVLAVANQVNDDAEQERASAPLAAVTVPSPGENSPECTALIAALPSELGEARKVEFLDPAPPSAAGYRMPSGNPVIVRCGLPAPPNFRVGAALQQVNKVQWFTEKDPDPSISDQTWIAVDRPQFVALTLPTDSGTGAIQDLSDVLSNTLKEIKPKPAPVG